jgi:hypothetical protein
MPYNKRRVYKKEFLTYIPEELEDVSDIPFHHITARVEAIQSLLLTSCM